MAGASTHVDRQKKKHILGRAGNEALQPALPIRYLQGRYVKPQNTRTQEHA